MRLGWIVIALCACGDSAKAPVAPIASADPPPPETVDAAVTPAPAPTATATATAPATKESEPATGNVWGDAIGDAFGADAGAAFAASVRPAPTPKGPTLRQGATVVNGKLPPEVVQRIVRQSFGRFRLCYENGLRANPKLGGNVIAKFTIRRAGDVSKATDGGSDLPDKNVIACVLKGMSNLSFPQPEGGEVEVLYPIVFTPGS